VHLATNFQNMFFDRLPEGLKSQMYAWLDEKNASERKPGMTNEQFYYKTRKNCIGAFKKQAWAMPAAKKAEIGQAWEEQFSKLFNLLGLKGTKKYVAQTIQAVAARPNLKFYLGEAVTEEDVSDLAD